MKPVIFVKNISKIYSRKPHFQKVSSAKALLKEIFAIKKKRIPQVDEFYAVKNWHIFFNEHSIT